MTCGEEGFTDMIRVLRLAVAAIVLAGGLAVAPAASAATGHPRFTHISAGNAHACALTSAGTVWCWGWNGHNQLGDGTNWSSSFPIPLPGLSGVRQVDAGGEFTCAVLDTGAVACWGAGSHGELGDGLSHESATPVTVSGVTDAVQVTAGDTFACALLANSQVECWGLNDKGQLGRGTVDATASPTSPGLAGMSGLRSISAGSSHVCGLRWAGDVWCWGYNLNGQTGQTPTGPAYTQPTPASVSGTLYSIGVAAGNGFSCSILADSSARCWGQGTNGQLGNNLVASSATPVQPTALLGLTSLTLGYDHACGVRVDGTAACWGGAAHGQLGNAAAFDLGLGVRAATPVDVDGDVAFTQVTAGTWFTCAIDALGEAYCWGFPADGQTAGGSLLAGVIIPLYGSPMGIAWDSTTPTAAALTVTPLVGWTLAGTTVPLQVRATIADPYGDTLWISATGPGASRIGRSVNSGAWATVTNALPSSEATETAPGILSAAVSALAYAPSSGTVRYRVTSVDRAGNVGSTATGATLSVRLVQGSDPAITYAGTWATQTSSAFSGGSTRYASKAGSSATYTFTGRSIALVTTVAPNRGAAKIYVDGVLKATIDAMQPGTTTARMVEWQKSWPSAGKHTVKVVVVGTAGRPRVDVDAFVVVK